MSIRRKQQSQLRDLEESLAALSVLEENLKKTDSITQKMSTLLSTVFDARLGKLEESIKPMYNTTRNLTQISQSSFPLGCLAWVLTVDIDSAIAAMDSMRKNFDTIPREEAIIRAGFALWDDDADKRPKQNISEYFGSITRLQSSLNTLSRSNMRSAENVQQMVFPYKNEAKVQSQLVKLGVKQLDDVFRRTLTTNSQVVDPTTFLVQGSSLTEAEN
jgi:exocyst complex component 7